MSKKLLIFIAVVPALIVTTALLYTFWQDFQNKKAVPTLSNEAPINLPITYSSRMKGWALKNALAENQEANPAFTRARQNLSDLLLNWGLWSYNGVKGVSKVMGKNSAMPLAVPSVSVRQMEVKIVPEPQPLFNRVNDQGLLVYSLGDEYNLESQTLTILINVSPSFLENNPVAHPRDLTPALNNILLARLYQLTYPGYTEEDAQNMAAYIYQNRLLGLNIFEIAKSNGN